VQEFRSAGVQEFRSSGVQEFRVARIRNCENKTFMNRELRPTQQRWWQAPELLQLLNSLNSYLSFPIQRDPHDRLGFAL
jgi:hypothetical protein